MSWREGSSPPTIVAGSSHNLCRALWLPAVLFPNQRVIMQPVRMRSTSAGVEWSEDAGAHSKLPQAVSEEEALMCVFFSTASGEWPCEILGDVNPRNLKLFTPLHRCLVDGDGCVFSALSPEIHHQLLGLVNVEWEVVLLTPFSQGTRLRSVGQSITSMKRLKNQIGLFAQTHDNYNNKILFLKIIINVKE